eukprot:3510963-Rhodomonas_salina.1
MSTSLQLTNLGGAGCERKSSCQEGRTVEKVPDQSTGDPAQSSCSTLQCRTPTWGKTGVINMAVDKIANGSLPVPIKKALK